VAVVFLRLVRLAATHAAPRTASMLADLRQGFHALRQDSATWVIFVVVVIWSLGNSGATLVGMPVLAKLALFHRGPLPRRKDPSLQSLLERDRDKVRVLSMLLRLAENLDRSQSGVVRDARLERVNRGGIGLTVLCPRCHGTKEDVVIAYE
jgi:exopolyphosphatase/pppGpp-phosphohydrolase